METEPKPPSVGCVLTAIAGGLIAIVVLSPVVVVFVRGWWRLFEHVWLK